MSQSRVMNTFNLGRAKVHTSGIQLSRSARSSLPSLTLTAGFSRTLFEWRSLYFCMGLTSIELPTFVPVWITLTFKKIRSITCGIRYVKLRAGCTFSNIFMVVIYMNSITTFKVLFLGYGVYLRRKIPILFYGFCTNKRTFPGFGI